MKERNRLNFAWNIKHIYISLGYEQPSSSTKKSTEKAWLHATPNSLLPATCLKFPPGITVKFGNAFFVKGYRIDQTSICFTVRVVLTPPPSVTPTASSADSAMSITSPASSAITILPL